MLDPNRSIQAFKHKEYFEFISQIGFVHPSRLKFLFEPDPYMADESPLFQLLQTIGYAKVSTLVEITKICAWLFRLITKRIIDSINNVFKGTKS